MSADNMSDEIQCRICLEYVNYNKYPEVFRPCACNTYIHRACLDKQLRVKPQSKCEVCNYEYIFNLYKKNTDIVIPVVIDPRPARYTIIPSSRLRILSFAESGTRDSRQNINCALRATIICTIIGVIAVVSILTYVFLT